MVITELNIKWKWFSNLSGCKCSTLLLFTKTRILRWHAVMHSILHEIQTEVSLRNMKVPEIIKLQPTEQTLFPQFYSRRAIISVVRVGGYVHQIYNMVFGLNVLYKPLSSSSSSSCAVFVYSFQIGFILDLLSAWIPLWFFVLCWFTLLVCVPVMRLYFWYFIFLRVIRHSSIIRKAMDLSYVCSLTLIKCIQKHAIAHKHTSALIDFSISHSIFARN